MKWNDEEADTVCDGVRGVMCGGHHRARIVAVPARQSSALIAISLIHHPRIAVQGKRCPAGSVIVFRNPLNPGDLCDLCTEFPGRYFPSTYIR